MKTASGIAASIIGALAIAVVSTAGDFIWAMWIPRHRPIYGLTHGVAPVLLNRFISRLDCEKTRDWGGCGSGLGRTGSGNFLRARPGHRPFHHVRHLVRRLGRIGNAERMAQRAAGIQPSSNQSRPACRGRFRSSLLPYLRNLVSVSSAGLGLPHAFCGMDRGIPGGVRGPAGENQKMIFTPNWHRRGLSAETIRPNVGEPTNASGRLKLARLNRLNASARSWRRASPGSAMCLRTARLTFWYAGPSRIFRPAFPKLPKGGATNAAVLNQRSGDGSSS